jgi:hypothetical protein
MSCHPLVSNSTVFVDFHFRKRRMRYVHVSSLDLTNRWLSPDGHVLGITHGHSSLPQDLNRVIFPWNNKTDSCPHSEDDHVIVCLVDRGRSQACLLVCPWNESLEILHTRGSLSSAIKRLGVQLFANQYALEFIPQTPQTRLQLCLQLYSIKWQCL